jgi:hypothetical protein
MTKIERVVVAWDKQDSSNEGWHVSTYTRDVTGNWCEGDDSQKVWFPVAVDDYTQEQSAELLAALALEFDGAAIELRA